MHVILHSHLSILISMKTGLFLRDIVSQHHKTLCILFMYETSQEIIAARGESAIGHTKHKH